MASSHVISDKHRINTLPLEFPNPKLLLGPGPSNAHNDVLIALSLPQIGHLDPQFIELMNQQQELLRYCFQTENLLTIPISGTGSASMESTFANLIEPEDDVLIFVAGYFGNRMVDMASRYSNKNINKIVKPFGSVFTLQEIQDGLNLYKPRVVGIVHADTSTGALQDLIGVADLVHAIDAYLIVDTVTSLGGVPLLVDEWKLDAVYSGSQKCLNCPPGIASLTVNARTVEKVMNRKTIVKNWYLDLTHIAKYWGPTRTYHHTAPVSMNYALRAALRIVAEEGLANRWKRHEDVANCLWNELEANGLECLVEKKNRLHSLTSVKVPEGVDSKKVTSYILQKYNMEIGNGLGELAGKTWRVGLMGVNATEDNAKLAVKALIDGIAATKDNN